jgi:hypothetical protein
MFEGVQSVKFRRHFHCRILHFLVGSLGNYQSAIELVLLDCSYAHSEGIHPCPLM